MLCMFQNEGLDSAYYYCGIATGALHGGMFLKGGKPSSAYYGFYAFGQLYKMGNQVEIKNKLRKDLYAVAAKGDDGSAALLISNVSEKKKEDESIQISMKIKDRDFYYIEFPLPSLLPTKPFCALI